MQSDAMNAGVIPGGLQSRTEIRVLVCFVLSNCSRPVPLDLLKEKLHFEGLANYFELSFAISELLENNNISLYSQEDGNDYFIATSAGKEIANQLGNTLPFSVRERAMELTIEVVERCNYERDNRVEIQKIDNKYYVYCSVMEKDMELASVKLLVPDNETALNVKNKFLSNPIETLANITSVLIGSKI